MYISIMKDLCKYCGKPPIVEKTEGGTVKRMFNDMHHKCYEIVKGSPPKSLSEINKERC